MSITMTKKISECHSETVQFMSIEKVDEDECITSRDPHTNVAVLRRVKKLQDNNNLTKEDVEYLNYRELLKYEQAPAYLQHNPYIRHGYRKLLPTKLCWESIFWWTNETMNIWTHIFGFFLLLFLTINDLLIINVHATVTDKIVAGILFSCFLVDEDECITSRDPHTNVAVLRRVKKLQDNNNLTKEDVEYLNYRELLKYEQAPAYLQHNPYIRHGYRKLLPTKLCWESIFWWTNETMNIWTHIFGFFLLLFLTINDLLIINVHATVTDKIVAGILFSCFLICMALSSLYHTFSCRSECDYNTFLMYDLFGIALSLLAIYTSGIYYAFWCNSDLKNFYMTSVTLIFIMAMVLQIPRLNVPYIVKMCVFIGWAAYGVVPTLHWTYSLGGFENPMVQIFFPRVIGMYVISGSAFIIYAFKVPERWFPGKVDYIGHSHQWWHVLVLGALYYWHNSAMIYVQYRMNHGCSNTMRIF